MLDRDVDEAPFDPPMFAPRVRITRLVADPRLEATPQPPGTCAFDAAFVEIIERPVARGTAHDAFAGKELELARLFATLTPAENLRLHRRLGAARSDDPLVAAFSRLVVERRVRLLERLADARRRGGR